MNHYLQLCSNTFATTPRGRARTPDEADIMRKHFESLWDAIMNALSSSTLDDQELCASEHASEPDQVNVWTTFFH